jgi:peptidoglycan/LPS O-acetylase OafA/YrhL
MPALQSPNPNRSWQRLDGVDALRALAILYVLLNHVNMRILPTHYLKLLPPQLSDALVWQGQAGVQIFFAVSGFLITSTSLKRWGSLAHLRIRDFYLIRFARIAPLFLTLLAVLSLLHALHLKDFVVPQKLGGLPAALTAAFTLRIGILEAHRGYLPGNWDILWSLSVEELFYLGFPVACVLLARGKAGTRPLIALLAVFVLLGPFARTILAHGNDTWQEYSYLGGMDAIALGCLTALFITGRTFTRRTLATLLATGLALMILCLVFSPQLWTWGVTRHGLTMTLLALGTCMVIAVAAQIGNQRNARASRALSPLLAYGRRSYEIYLTHMFLVYACFDVFSAHGSPLRAIPILFVVTILLAGILGSLVARFFSEPANRFLRSRFHDGPAALGSVLQPE